MDSTSINFIKNLHSLPEDFREYLAGLDTLLYYGKNSYLVNPGFGQVPGWLVLSGLLKKFRYHQNGKLLVSRFWKEGEFATIEECFAEPRLNEYYICCLEDCVLLPVHYHAMCQHESPFCADFIPWLLQEADRPKSATICCLFP